MTLYISRGVAVALPLLWVPAGANRVPAQAAGPSIPLDARVQRFLDGARNQ
jgi:hypothetical protein